MRSSLLNPPTPEMIEAGVAASEEYFSDYDLPFNPHPGFRGDLVRDVYVAMARIAHRRSVGHAR